MLYSAAAIAAAAGIALVYRYGIRLRGVRRDLAALNAHLHPAILKGLRGRPGNVTFAGERAEMSALFSNIRGFTSLSEKMAPLEIVSFLNQYFQRMVALVFRCRGTLDKLIGDGLLCFWGHPSTEKDHGLRAALCALEMLQAAEDLRPVLVLPGGAKLEVSIGVHSGPMVVGNMGAPDRFNYTVVGENVNLGKRLESLNKHYGTKILISSATYESCKDIVLCREIDTIQLRNKAHTVTLYEPLGVRKPSEERRRADRRGPLTAGKRIRKALVLAWYGERREETRRRGSERLYLKPEQEEIASFYEHALTLYRRGDLDAAEMAFDHVLTLSPADGPSRLMKSRINRYRHEHLGVEVKFDPVYRFDG